LHLLHHLISAGHHDDSGGKNDGEGNTSEIESDEDGVGPGKVLILERLGDSGLLEEDRLVKAGNDISVIDLIPIASFGDPLWDHLGVSLVVDVVLLVDGVSQVLVSSDERAEWLRGDGNRWVAGVVLLEPGGGDGTNSIRDGIVGLHTSGWQGNDRVSVALLNTWEVGVDVEGLI